MNQERLELTPNPDNPLLPAKPQDSIQRELKIRNSLIEQGVEREIADAVIGYRPEDVPFVYQSEPHEVLHHRVRNNWTEGYELIPGQSALWIGTTDAIHNLVDDNGWNDQIPEVIVQWRGSFVNESEQQDETASVTRTEVKQLGDGRFVEVEYTGVSGMGAFDGDISQIALHVPENKFRPYGGNERQSYRIYYFKRTRKPNMDGVPGGVLIRKDKEQYEWSLNTSYSNVVGTTILNGYQEILNFHMPDLAPLKEDYSKAYRFSPLPKPKNPALLPASPEHQFQLILNGETAITRDRILEVAPEAEELMRIVAPQALDRLAQGGYVHDAVQMEVDGILNHPDKIWVFDKMLEQFPREQRFGLARCVAKMVKDGHLTTWAQTLREHKNAKFVNDVVNRNTRHLLVWFKQKAPADADLRGWIEKARNAAKIAARTIDTHSQTMVARIDGMPGAVAGKNPFHSPEYQRVFDGMVTSLVERFIEYAGQLYLGNTLE